MASRQFRPEAFWLIARQRQFDRDGQPFELLIGEINPFNQPQKPTDGGKKKKKKKKKTTVRPY